MTPAKRATAHDLVHAVALNDLMRAVRDVWRAKLDDMPDFVRMDAAHRYFKARDVVASLPPEEVRDAVERGLWLAHTGGRR